MLPSVTQCDVIVQERRKEGQKKEGGPGKGFSRQGGSADRAMGGGRAGGIGRVTKFGMAGRAGLGGRRRDPCLLVPNASRPRRIAIIFWLSFLGFFGERYDCDCCCESYCCVFHCHGNCCCGSCSKVSKKNGLA